MPETAKHAKNYQNKQLLLAYGLDDASRMTSIMRHELPAPAAAAGSFHATFTRYAMDRWAMGPGGLAGWGAARPSASRCAAVLCASVHRAVITDGAKALHRRRAVVTCHLSWLCSLSGPKAAFCPPT